MQRERETVRGVNVDGRNIGRNEHEKESTNGVCECQNNQRPQKRHFFFYQQDTDTTFSLSLAVSLCVCVLQAKMNKEKKWKKQNATESLIFLKLALLYFFKLNAPSMLFFFFSFTIFLGDLNRAGPIYVEAQGPILYPIHLRGERARGRIESFLFQLFNYYLFKFVLIYLIRRVTNKDMFFDKSVWISIW